MTLRNCAEMLLKNAVGNRLNGESWSRDELYDYLKRMLRTGDTVVMEIEMHDGRWYCAVDRYNDKVDGYDYTIPDDRIGEKYLLLRCGMVDLIKDR